MSALNDPCPALPTRRNIIVCINMGEKPGVVGVHSFPSTKINVDIAYSLQNFDIARSKSKNAILKARSTKGRC